MTTITRKFLETPMAPYSRLLEGMSREDKKIVIMFLTESLAKSESEENVSHNDVVANIRRKFNVPESKETKWFREHSAKHEWNPQEAWNSLTDKQRKEATEKLHMSPEDMDELTFGIIKKHMI